jgi:hypothetical protein
MSNRNYYAALLTVKEDISSSSADEWLPAAMTRFRITSRNRHQQIAEECCSFYIFCGMGRCRKGHKTAGKKRSPQKALKHTNSPLERSTAFEKAPEAKKPGEEASRNGLHDDFPALRQIIKGALSLTLSLHTLEAMHQSCAC